MSIMSLEEASKKEVQQQNGNFNLRSICIMLRPYQQEKITDPIMKLQGSPVSGKINIIEGPAAAGKTTAIVLGLNQSISLVENLHSEDIENPFYFTQICPTVDPLLKTICDEPFYNALVDIQTKTKRKDIVIVIPKAYYVNLGRKFSNQIERIKDLGVEFVFAQDMLDLKERINDGEYTRPLVMTFFAASALIQKKTLYAHKKLTGIKTGDGSRLLMIDEGQLRISSSDGKRYEHNTENPEDSYSDVTLKAIETLDKNYDVRIGLSATISAEQRGEIDSPIFNLISTIPKRDVQDYQKTFDLNYTEFSRFPTDRRWTDDEAESALWEAYYKMFTKRNYMDSTYNMNVNSTGIVYTNVSFGKCTDIKLLKKIVRRWYRDEDTRHLCKQILFYDSKDKAVVYNGNKFVEVGKSLNDCIPDIEAGKYLLTVCVNSAVVGVDIHSWTTQFYFRPINKDERFLTELQRIYRCIRFNDTCLDFPYKSVKEYEESEDYNSDILYQMNTAEIYFCNISADRTEALNRQLDKDAYILKRVA